MKLTVTNVDRVAGTWRVKYSVAREPGEEQAYAHRIAPEHSVFIHAFPDEKIVSLALEYGLNADDMSEIMDVLLAEPFLDDHDGEPTLFSGEDPLVIKEAHLRRCARAKLAIRLSTRGIQNPVEIIRSTPVSARTVGRVKEFWKGR